MPEQIDALVVDDDIWSLRLMKGLLGECFPRIGVHVRQTPDCHGAFDIYFIDNDFAGEPIAARLAAEIRSRQPDALIIAYSANLDATTLKALINAGCNGACDKSNPADLPRAMTIVREFIEARLAGGREREGRGLIETIRSVRGLLHEWNSRLDNEERELSGAAGGAA
jgi:DNA-binding NarL/FixJ family response regulator